MLIAIQNVTKYFKKNHLRKDETDTRFQVLDNITFTIQDGEFVSFIGPSGCGKSTLLRMIAGLLPADGGRVLVDGQKVKGPGSDRMMVFQDYVLFPWMNVRKNISAGLKIRGENKESVDKKTDWAIGLVGLEGFEQVYPHQLSGGMKQRVAIARAIVMNPDILLMDEPFGALDSFTRINLQEELIRLWEKNHYTTCLVTHDCDEAVYLSDRIVVFTSSPARVQDIISVDLPRPRDRNRSEFIDLRNHILQLGRIQAEQQERQERCL
ncbi:MAG TPA: ABC transporter ATP-binding protein [Lachnospiraceae bacterium]|nr:ABC transporter ATP-binding protein [Lachnospiraceae bacterium]